MSPNINMGGLVFAIVVIVIALPYGIVEIRRHHGPDRSARVIATFAALAFGVVNAAKALGWLEDGPFFWTLRFSTGGLFLLTMLQLVKRERQRRNPLG